ncbi:hypothetical protein E3Q12_00771 [Wallemia mellicola]|uniref:DUF4042 domain-containing protein n=2 Tax=Wallemia mellicola TaxID=1708541 RepID=A0AB74KIJ1_9BASI|nr:hypothetical protein E3Q12_00771 [Wallemia mellicola]TIC71154.1 hypothetical protein E3Q03_00718 [Wallemia mellicola]
MREMSVDLGLLQRSEAIAYEYHYQSSDHLGLFQSLLRDDIDKKICLGSYNQCILLKSINSLISNNMKVLISTQLIYGGTNNIQGDEELLDICLQLGCPGHKYSIRKKALKVLIQLYSKKPKRDIGARTNQIIKCLDGIPQNAISLLRLALHSLLVALTKLTLTPQHVQLFIELFFSNVITIMQDESKTARRSASISSLRSHASDMSSDNSTNWRFRDDHASDMEEEDSFHVNIRDIRSDVILQATMCISQLAHLISLQSHVKFVFNHIFKLLPDMSLHVNPSFTLWDIIYSENINQDAKLSTIQCIEQILRSSRPFLYPSADLNYTSLAYRLGSLLWESHERLSDLLSTNEDTAIQVALLNLSVCLVNVTPYSRMTSDTPTKLCAELQKIIFALNNLEQPSQVASLCLLQNVVDAGLLKEDEIYFKKMSKWLYDQVFIGDYSLVVRTQMVDVLAKIWVSFPVLRVAEDFKRLFNMIFNKDEIELKIAAIQLLSLHPEMQEKLDDKLLTTSHQIGKDNCAFNCHFLDMLGASLGSNCLKDDILYDTVEWILEGVYSVSTDMKVAGLSATKNAFRDTRIRSNDDLAMRLEKACVDSLINTSHIVKQKAGFALADYLDVLQLSVVLKTFAYLTNNRHELSKSRWQRLFDIVSMMQAKDKGKAQVHVFRAYGSILEKSQGLNDESIDQAKRMINVLKDELQPQLNYKIQWNAATALGRAFANRDIYESCSSVIESVVNSLQGCESKTRNMKTKNKLTIDR